MTKLPKKGTHIKDLVCSFCKKKLSEQNHINCPHKHCPQKKGKNAK